MGLTCRWYGGWVGELVDNLEGSLTCRQSDGLVGEHTVWRVGGLAIYLVGG